MQRKPGNQGRNVLSIACTCVELERVHHRHYNVQQEFARMSAQHSYLQTAMAIATKAVFACNIP